MKASSIAGKDTKPRIYYAENKQIGIINYDVDNQYPQRMELLKASSGTTTRCVNTYSRFLVGQGFKDASFWKAKINRHGGTIDGMLRKHTKDFALTPGIAIHINYNILLEPVGWSYIPFSFIRLCSQEKFAGKVAVYNDWSCKKKTRIKIEDIDFIDVFVKDKRVIQKQIDAAGGFGNWKGHIYWVSADENEYPLSKIDPVIEDVQSDAETKYFRLRSLTTNFMPSHLLITDPAESDDSRDEFHEELENFQGAKDSHKIFHVEKTPEQTVELQKFDVQDTDKMFEITNRTIKDSIIEVFGIPSILLNVRVPGELGNDSKKLKEATDFFNGLTDDDRKFISEAYKHVFEGTGLNPSEDYDILPLSTPVTADNIPKEFLPDLDKNERRGLVSFPAEANPQSTQAILATVIGVGGVTAFQTILTDPTLSVDQKKASLKLLFNLTNDQVSSLFPIGLTNITVLPKGKGIGNV